MHSKLQSMDVKQKGRQLEMEVRDKRMSRLQSACSSVGELLIVLAAVRLLV